MEASNEIIGGAGSSACASPPSCRARRLSTARKRLVRGRGVSPKRHSDEVRLKAVALLLEMDNATRAAEMMAADGTEVDPTTISEWASGMRPNLKRGRPIGTTGTPGARGPRDQRSPYRERVLELWAGGKGMPQTEIAKLLGLPRQLVHYLIRSARAS